MGAMGFLFTGRQQRILGALLRDPEKWMSFSEIARVAGPGKGATQVFLRSLEESGFVIRKPLGNQVLYKPNRAHPVFEEIRSIALKTFGLADVLRGRLMPFVDRIEVAFVFGSMAKGTDRPDSDVDLLVAGDVVHSTFKRPLRGSSRSSAVTCTSARTGGRSGSSAPKIPF